MSIFRFAPTRFPVALLLTAAFLLSGMLTITSEADAISPKRVVATRTKGVKTIAGLWVNGPPLTLAKVRETLGVPDKTKRTSPSTCEALYSGVKLIFTSFGGETTCGSLYLQSGVVLRHIWKVQVGAKVYRVGQSSSRIPDKAKKFPFYGYQLASMPFIGSSTGSVFARAPGNRITAIPLFIGGAGD